MSHRPLADRLRPKDLSAVLGQDRWLGEGGVLRRAIEADRLFSMVLWGPPGCGKTTIARALAHHTDHLFVQISAVLDGVKDLRGVIERAGVARRMEQRGTLLFVDEIHRWNKAQQDALLPHVEAGDLLLVGATTENPSFSLTSALRSRLRVVRLEPLAEVTLLALLRRALATDPALGDRQVTEDALQALARLAGGDARRALTDLERALDATPADEALGVDALGRVLQRSDLRHDRSGDDHYNVVSALIKSLRGSDPDAALYWLARMLEAGEDPRFVARRLVIFASEDVGNADPRGLEVAVAAAQAVQLVGMPEGRIPLAQAVTWLATCPKSNASYAAIDAAIADVRAHGALPVPLHLRNASPEGSYLYPHDYPHHIVEQQYLPDTLIGQVYYRPAPHGVEKTIADRMAWWKRKIGGS